MGRYYTLSSTVVEGNKLGRTIGYPTANLALPSPHKLIPANGVYAVWATINGERYAGMMNIGMRPTVDGTHLTLEVHLLNFDRDIYGEILTVEFVAQLRQEEKFSSLDALKAQLAKDREATEKALAL